MTERGQLQPEQIRQLLEAVKPYRVKLREGHSHMEGYDIRAHLTRIFGFEGWDLEGDPAQLIHERELDTGRKKESSGWPIIRYSCAYRQHLYLVVYDDLGRLVKRALGQAVGKAENQPSFGDAHDLALKDAETQALKRAAMNLGDQFGLGLYNKQSGDGKGGYKACVKVTLVRMPDASDGPELETPEVGDEGDDARRSADSAPEETATAPERNGRPDDEHVTAEDVEHMKTLLADLTRGERERVKAEREELGYSVEWGHFTVKTLRWIMSRAAELLQLREATLAALDQEGSGPTPPTASPTMEQMVAEDDALAAANRRKLEAAAVQARREEAAAQGLAEPPPTETRAEARRRAGGARLATKAQRDKVAETLEKQTPEVRSEVEAWATAEGHQLGDQLTADSVAPVTSAILNTARAHKLKGKQLSQRGKPQADAPAPPPDPEAERRALRRTQWSVLTAAAEALGAEDTWAMAREELEREGIAQPGTDQAQLGRVFIQAGADQDDFLAGMVQTYQEVLDEFEGRPFEGAAPEAPAPASTLDDVDY